jgi:hypothetical protein
MTTTRSFFATIVSWLVVLQLALLACQPSVAQTGPSDITKDSAKAAASCTGRPT